MKKNIVMAFVAALLFGGISAQAQAQASTPVTTATAAGPLKLGYTSMDYLLSQVPEAKDIQNQLTIQRTQLENEAKRLEKEFQDKLQAYEKGAAQMSEVIRADREKELQGLQTRYQEFQRNAESQLQNKYQQLVNPVLQKIQKNVDAVAKENGYSYVFNLDAGAGTAVILLVAPEEHNITDIVLKKMGVTPAPATPAKAGTGAATPPANTPAPKKN
ncbi:OmpH family outer membrane protein [Rudanella paleaurantiibacter]|uniref:OmpH family outer membrane protein n=1 Tax=Rudanella paleaurantiibacter TaxID=2614655 RepID=A0A7J5U2Y4_9BACT|nr:OmpH family outer membrane protein [Rudanella paleaurantiibacter]KAB7732164.1 OmpH family outer membrane protein [Rudanella paleaurantiibacter]